MSIVRYALEKNIEIVVSISPIKIKEQVHWCFIAPVGDKPKLLAVRKELDEGLITSATNECVKKGITVRIHTRINH
jgi:hypothetical protein